MNNNKDDIDSSTQYVRNLAKKAMGLITLDDESSIDNVKKEFGEKKSLLNKRNFAGLFLGLVVGFLICLSASFIGIKFSGIESAFIIGQFSLLGALMFYMYS